MAFVRVTEADMDGKGNLGQPDTPGVSTMEMQRILDELPREVLAPAHNQLADQLEAADAAASLGAAPPESLPEGTSATVQGVIEAVLEKGNAHALQNNNPHSVTALQVGAYTKGETDAAIAQRVVEIGAGDMAQAVYDPTGQKKDIFSSCATAAQGARADTAVQTVNGKAGTALTLTPADVGAATAAQGAKADTAVQTVNGKAGPAAIITPELLWTNPAPGDLFDPQTVSLNTGNYTFFLVIYSASSGYQSILAQKGVRHQLNSAAYYNYIRPFTITNGQVTFEAGQYYAEYGSASLTTYGYSCIPWKIFGVL